MPSRSPADLQRERKRKNAEAQSQFRQRRANYISSLEETVTKLEAVVLELQDSLREAKNESDQTTEEKKQLSALVEQLRHEQKIKESEWRNAWHAKLPNVPFPSNGPVLPSPSSLSGLPESPRIPNIPSCLDPNLKFGHNLKDRPQLPPQFEDGPAPFAFNVHMRSTGGSSFNDPRSVPSTHPSRPPSSSAYSTGTPPQGLMFRSLDDGVPASHIASTSTGFRRGIDGRFELQLPHASAFPDTSSNGLSYLPRMPGLFTHPGELASPLGHNSRSMSPHSPHASPSSAATSASSHIHYLPELPAVSTDNVVGSMKPYNTLALNEPPLPTSYTTNDSSTFGITRRSDLPRRATFPAPATPFHPQPAHMTSHSAGLSNIPPPIVTSDRFVERNLSDLSPGRQRSSTVNPNAEPVAVSESRRRSSSPAISNTLAVIKAQAFGALRRNRTHKRRGNGYATKVALEALQARGLGLGLEPTTSLSSPNHHVDEEDGGMQQDSSDQENMEN